MYSFLNYRSRATLVSSFFLFLILLGCILWPWFSAALIWQKSTINYPIISLSNHTRMKIPAIIHQTWRDENTIPNNWQQASKTCRSLHPNYEYRFWTDAAARRLIEKEFPCLLSTYDSYPYDIQRADVIRLIVLYVFGGIYLDLDVICLKPLDQLRGYEFILPKTMPAGLSNDVIIAQPKHPFLLQLLNNLPKANRNYLTKYATVMFSTGPMYITHEASNYVNRSSIDVLSQDLYGKYTHNSTRSLFKHLKASSWHGNDAALVKWIYRRRIILLLLLAVSLASALVLIYLARHRHSVVNLVKKFFSKEKIKYEEISSNLVSV
ncbi:unnamed protein product [Adineta ricciae]|uniref:Uncharacterized protein n=1 Tax=Adineta ricciae TaxID=249248 RepID=A0A814LYF0_ADIRI|nr:unnamed protein product [Adineta ricciae]